MLLLDYRHKQFDLLLEILASIPPSPWYAELDDLVHDFGVLNQRTLRKDLKEINKKYGCLFTRNFPGRRVVSIRRDAFRKLEPLIESYIDLMDGETDGTE